MCFKVKTLREKDRNIEKGRQTEGEKRNGEMGKERENKNKKVNQAKCTDDKAIVH